MSGDLVRLQGYPSSHLISYILEGLRCLGGLLCHFANWFLGVAFSCDLEHHSYIGTSPTMLNFTKGNAKLGKHTLIFNLPAGRTCPAQGSVNLLCRSMRTASVRFRMVRNQFSAVLLHRLKYNTMQHFRIEKIIWRLLSPL